MTKSFFDINKKLFLMVVRLRNRKRRSLARRQLSLIVAIEIWACVVFTVVFTLYQPLLNTVSCGDKCVTTTDQRENYGWHETFTKEFRTSLQADHWDGDSRSATTFDRQIPFIIRNNTLYCLKNQRHDILNGHERSRMFVEMLRAALQESIVRDQRDFFAGDNGTLPIALTIHDDNGCYLTLAGDKGRINKFDERNSPILSWVLPSPVYGTDWCRGMAVPTFGLWQTASEISTEEYWEGQFELYRQEYPWSSKQNKAVWRGSSTYYIEFQAEETKIIDIPRGKLVEKTRDHPELIDAKFTAMIQKFESQRDEFGAQTIMGDFVDFNDQMKYKAILDIDGNTYSERFSKLLCTNSVVIKIEPRWVEYFWDQLEPMVHYVPASLENLTEVASYVMDQGNDREMQRIVSNANEWCRKTNTRTQILSDALTQIKKFEQDIESLWLSHHEGWAALASDISRGDYHFVEC